MQGESNAMAKCLDRAWGNLLLFCNAQNLRVDGVRGFTVLNLHASKGAFPWLGCKGSDSIILLKWLVFLARLYLSDAAGLPVQNQQVFSWIVKGAKAGLSFSQGIHGHGLWLRGSCVKFLRNASQQFGASYAHLAAHCLRKKWTLFGMVPKLHASMHFRTEMDDSLQENREWTLNPACFDNSMSEDFIGRVARQSRRISFKNVERTILSSYKVKLQFEVKDFKRRRGQ